MTYYTKSQLKKILSRYNGDFDLPPQPHPPVPWYTQILADALLEALEKIEELESRLASLEPMDTEY